MSKMHTWLVDYQRLLSQQFGTQTLPHAILINGVKGAGKLQLAQWLMQILSCQKPINGQQNILQPCQQCKTCLLKRSNTLPDHLNLLAEKTSLGVDEIRQANSFLQKTTQLCVYKTVLIRQAELMTVSAANALLKTLEEPADNSIIVLLTDDLDRLLPTIISRSRVLTIRPAVGQLLMEKIAIQAGNVNSGAQANFVNLTQLPELTDIEVNASFQHFKSTYLHYLYYQQGENQLLQQILDSDYSLRWLEQITVNLQREQLFAVTDTPTEQHQLSAQVLNQIYKAIIKGCKVIKSYTQANKQFACEKLVMVISDILLRNKLDIQN